MTSKIANDVHISVEENEPSKVGESDQNELREQLSTSSRNEQESNFSGKYSAKYATLDNLTKQLSLEKKTEFSEFFQTKCGKRYGIFSNNKFNINIARPLNIVFYYFR